MATWFKVHAQKEQADAVCLGDSLAKIISHEVRGVVHFLWAWKTSWSCSVRWLSSMTMLAGTRYSRLENRWKFLLENVGSPPVQSGLCSRRFCIFSALKQHFSGRFLRGIHKMCDGYNRNVPDIRSDWKILSESVFIVRTDTTRSIPCIHLLLCNMPRPFVSAIVKYNRQLHKRKTVMK